MKAVGVFVDIPNLHNQLQRKFNHKLDYKKYLDFAKGYGEVIEAFAYGSQYGDAVKTFLHRLRVMGYEVIGKHKDNIPMAIDIIENIVALDIFIIGTSDSSILPILDRIQATGKPVIIIAANVPEQICSHPSVVTCTEIYASMLEVKHETYPE